MLVASLRFPGGLRVEQHDCSVCSPYSSSSTVPECGETSVFRLEVILGGAKSYSNVVGGLLIRSVLNIGLGTTRKPGKHSGYSCAGELSRRSRTCTRTLPLMFRSIGTESVQK